ncbi:phenylalanine 4-monooxygenase [Aestuariispira insulae]|uniref:Phenylalanine-4-hydroxylase n=1 Tax=Aestuariispira insulae TaxID=1461337 RepID=A0A3D9HIC0_9PROT|nr:phenylalanine 4-monooxygenase [Aestuariispira insulae]RED49230.1 phenylalanine 4-hydroxylase [Aestuariispira insulae]
MDTENLRGDYTHMRDDWTVEQDMAAYSEAEHQLWRRLYRRQIGLMPDHAAPEFIEGLEKLDCANGIPDLEKASDTLQALTGFRLVAVPGLVPDDVFFDHLANRRFPVTVWLREPEEFDYLVEPDIFHDFFGHVPLLSNPVFADFLEAYGRKGPEAIKHGGLKCLARLYWYMVEFGLIKTDAGLRIFGAGILSSSGETVHSLTSPASNRIGFDIDRIMQTDYDIDSYQQTYFVIEDYQDLFDASKVDFKPLYAKYADKPPLHKKCLLDGDRFYAPEPEALPKAG